MILAQSPINGNGLFAARDYQDGYVIGIVDGPVVSRQMATDDAIEPKPGLYIEIAYPFKYVNHSCTPNCELLGERVVVTTRGIVAGEELFFDYSDFVHDEWNMNCNCGSDCCRGLIGRLVSGC